MNYPKESFGKDSVFYGETEEFISYKERDNADLGYYYEEINTAIY